MVNRARVNFLPLTYSIINSVPEITTCFFSILRPGKHIPLHRGPYAGVLRCHLALKVPENITDCWISVDNIRCKWKLREVIIFDDTYEHEVYNNSSDIRIVLFIDFLRPLSPLLHMQNKAMLQVIKHSELFKTHFLLMKTGKKRICSNLKKRK